MQHSAGESSIVFGHAQKIPSTQRFESFSLDQPIGDCNLNADSGIVRRLGLIVAPGWLCCELTAAAVVDLDSRVVSVTGVS